jgi:hypothetical protein
MSRERPADYWEGHLVNDQLLYLTQILAAPQTAHRLRRRAARRPRHLSEHRQHARAVRGDRLPSDPTSNNDPDYALPGGVGTVPHMQPAGRLPKLIEPPSVPADRLLALAWAEAPSARATSTRSSRSPRTAIVVAAALPRRQPLLARAHRGPATTSSTCSPIRRVAE